MIENLTSENANISQRVLGNAAQVVSGLALSGDDAAIVARHLDAVLMAPVRELMGRPHKSIRAQLVTAGYHLGQEILLARGADQSGTDWHGRRTSARRLTHC